MEKGCLVYQWRPFNLQQTDALMKARIHCQSVDVMLTCASSHRQQTEEVSPVGLPDDGWLDGFGAYVVPKNAMPNWSCPACPNRYSESEPAPTIQCQNSHGSSGSGRCFLAQTSQNNKEQSSNRSDKPIKSSSSN